MDTLISDERTGRQFRINLTPEELIKAKSDKDYLCNLIQKYYDDEAQNTEPHESSRIKEESHEVIETTDLEETQNQNSQNPSIFIWNEQCIFLLLNLYEEYKEDFKKKRHKLIFDEIARKMLAVNPNYKINGVQCQSKISSLKKMYKKIKDHNSTSGNDRATWPYFERMQEIFGHTGWIQPLAVADESGPSGSGQENVSHVNIQNKKRKMEAILEDLLEEKKKRYEQKQELLKKMIDMKENQHQEKISILKELCRNMQKK